MEADYTEIEQAIQALWRYVSGICGTLGSVLKPAWSFVGETRPRRSFAQKHHRQQRQLKRSSHLPPLEARAQTTRISSNEAQSQMRQSQRRHTANYASPWKDAGWVQENLKDLDEFASERSPKRRKLLRNTYAPVSVRKSAYLSRMYGSTRLPSARPTHDLLDTVTTLSRGSNEIPFLLLGEQDELAAMEDQKAVNGHESESPHEPDFTPVRPSRIQRDDSTSEDELASTNQENVIDPREQRKFDNFLKKEHVPYDAPGSRMQVVGRRKSESKLRRKPHMPGLWQEETDRKESMLDHITSSRYLEKSGVFRVVHSKASLNGHSEQPSAEQTTNGELLLIPNSDEATSKLSPIHSSIQKANLDALPEVVKTPTRGTEKTISLLPHADTDHRLDKDTELKEEVSLKEEQPIETPAQAATAFSRLSIHRTPKARNWTIVKSERKTRLQLLQEQREAEKALGEYKLVELGKEWDAKVRNAVRQGTEDGKYTATDFARVVPEYSPSGRGSSWLNDAVINDYLTLVAKHGCKDDRPSQVPSHVALSSFFYSKLADDPAKAPPGWTRRAKIPGKSLLDAKMVFLPINSGAHWTLCVIEPHEKRLITMYNSMGHGSNERHAANVRAWLRHHLGNAWIEEEWNTEPRGVSPQQNNSDDCGVFTCTTARQLMLGQFEKDPYDHNIMPVQRRRMIAELLNKGLIKADES